MGMENAIIASVIVSAVTSVAITLSMFVFIDRYIKDVFQRLSELMTLMRLLVKKAGASKSDS